MEAERGTQEKQASGASHRTAPKANAFGLELVFDEIDNNGDISGLFEAESDPPTASDSIGSKIEHNQSHSALYKPREETEAFYSVGCVRVAVNDVCVPRVGLALLVACEIN